ncbi:dynein assembly factor with WD repeat domains 1 isoform X2 [Pseudorca crassidens]|uniref:dynein assembly factor with WD repeat domains 1 isoform X2 n=1 Tax=Pseudorca crassidens TaxID=82174 RepID=UPI00352CADEC
MTTKSVGWWFPGERMKLKGLLLRYYPPGIMLEYEESGQLKTKSIDLLDLHTSTDVNALVQEIQKAEPLITASRANQVKLLIQRLQNKLGQYSNHKFYLFKVLRAHILPLTNVALNKSGSCFITGSYDRTCKLWDTASGEELHTLEGHRNVVYAVAFNNPYGDRIATGSFDKTCKLWSVETGNCYHTFRGHTAEIGHSAEIISLSFNTSGNRIITGSFDHTVTVWDADTGRKVFTLIGHCAEISSALFNWDCSLILTGSMDRTCMLWNATDGKCVATLTGHGDEILDSCFDYTGKLIATASADGTARVFSAATRKCITKLEGHVGEISKISFNPQGNRLLTGSSDKTARIWDVQTGQCFQVLEGHTDEIFSCAFNYKGDIIITGRGEINTIDLVFLSNWLLELRSWIPKGDTPIPTRVPSSSWCLLCPLFHFSCIAEPQE